MGGELIPKLLELLLELVPEGTLIGLLRDPTNPLDLQELASAKGVQFRILEAISQNQIDAAFATLVELRPGGLIVYTGNRVPIAALTLRHSIPAIALWRDFPRPAVCSATDQPLPTPTG
jgi:hypothetical protein